MYLLVLSNEQPHYTHWFSTVVGVWHRVDVLLDPVVEIPSPLWNPQLEHKKSASPSLYTNTYFYVTGYFTISPHCRCSGWLANSRSSPRSTSRPTLITSCRQYSSLRNLLLTHLPFPSLPPTLRLASSETLSIPPVSTLRRRQAFGKVVTLLVSHPSFLTVRQCLVPILAPPQNHNRLSCPITVSLFHICDRNSVFYVPLFNNDPRQLPFFLPLQRYTIHLCWFQILKLIKSCSLLCIFQVPSK